jgi:phosphoenolpyruvate phosphomutase
MKALILAAGVGRRLGACGIRTPKCLLRIGTETTVLDRQLRSLRAHGVAEVVVAAGHQAERVTQHLQAYDDLSCTVVVVPDHGTTNYIHTLHRCRHLLDDDVLLLHGDLVFDAALLGPLLAHPCSSALVHRGRVHGSKDFVARIEGGRVGWIGVGRGMPGLHHPVAPLYRLQADDMAAWMAAIDAFVSAGRVGCYAEEALNPLLETLRIEPVWFTGDRCMEVDTIGDLRRARQLFARSDGASCG